jgi:methylenetetrahydrofolate dehydrogenase (NADP+)/methenyltetrahydrofolate cyclohydrolase
MEILDGKELAQKIRAEIKQEVKACLIRPSLAVIQIGEDEENDIYIKNKEKACSEVGIYFRHFKFDDQTPELSIINKIKELNNDEYVNGIIVKLPIPEKYNEKRILNTIINSKDIDGLTDINTGRLINGKKTLIPCTPLGIITLLKEYGIEISGKDICIIGRSKLVGRPLASLLLSEDATVTVCHSKTNDLKSKTLSADIVISAAGVPNLVTADMIKKDAVVVDVGISHVDGKLVGDVKFDEVSKKASYITPVPGGVGPMTIAMLLSNVMTCYKNKK